MNDTTNDKRAKFEKYSAQRIKQATSAIERLSKLSASSYQWTPDEVAGITRDLKASVDTMLGAFKSRRAWKTLGGK